MHSLFNILYTLCLHEWSCRDHKTWKLIISYSKVFKSFSHSWKFASDATSGSFEPKSESTTSTKQKVSLANKNRPGGDLEKIYWMEMSMCLQIYLSYLTLRQRRGTRSICSWERRMSTGLQRAAGGAVLAATVKALLMLLGFSWCYSTCKAALFFFPLLFLILSFPQEQQWKSILLSCFSRSHLTPLHPTFQELCCCCGVATSTALGFCIFIYNTRTSPWWTYYLKLERGLF